MQRYDFYFQVVAGSLLVLVCSFVALGLSSDTVLGKTVCDPASPFWVAVLWMSPSIIGAVFCGIAYWRSGRRPNSLAWVFVYGAMYFYIVLKGNRVQPEPDDPSNASVILVIVTLAVIAAAFFIYDRVCSRRFTGDFPAVQTNWSQLAFAGRIAVFILCLVIALGVVYTGAFRSESTRMMVFIFVVLLGCAVTGLISEQTAATLLPWLKK
jgi:hypothetical protein